MHRIIILLSLYLVSCNNGNNRVNAPQPAVKSPVIEKKDSVITLQMHVKKGERFSFGYLDDVFNFNMIETPEKPDTTVFEKKIISHKPIFLKDIDYQKQNYFYLVPGEVYKVTMDSGFSNFEVLHNPQRTYEVNVLKELRRHHQLLKKFKEFDFEEDYSIMSFKNMDLKFRDSLLKNDYRENLAFLDKYASINSFSSLQKQIMARYLFYKYHAATLNFNMKNPGKVSKYLLENKQLYTTVLNELDCDTCFNYPHYYYLAGLFAKAFIADPRKQAVKTVYNDYRNFFKGKTRDFLLYDLIKFGGMFNYTKPDPILAKQFLSDAKDTALKYYIKEMYEFLEIKKSSKGILADFSGMDVSWEKLLEKHIGKVMYVDFWASWCGPCRSEMPASHLLQKRFAGREIVFIYISLDENSVDWKKAARLDGIDKGESYIMAQPDKSELIKKYKISSIPKYFLIDRSGKIVNPNALRPGDGKIVNEIELLLQPAI